MLSFRSLVEICFPPDFAPVVSDFLVWFTPLIFGLAIFWFGRDFFRQHTFICVSVIVVVVLAYLNVDLNTQYTERQGRNLYLADGAWRSLIELGGHNHGEAEAGQISWEEFHYRSAILNQGIDLIVQQVMPASAFNDAYYPLLASYDERESRIRTLRSGLQGGTISHWQYRLAIDRMNEEPGPFQGYLEVREKENAKWRNAVFIPVGIGVVLLIIMGLVYRHGGRAWRSIRDRLGQREFEAKLEPFNHARGVDGLASLEGPLVLRFPTLFVGSVPLDLLGARFDREKANVLHLADGERLWLYSAAIKPVAEVFDPRKSKPRFFFDPGASNCTPPSRQRESKSIFDKS